MSDADLDQDAPRQAPAQIVAADVAGNYVELDNTKKHATGIERRNAALTPFNSERAKVAQARRYELAGQRARQAALAAAEKVGLSARTPLDMLEYVAEQHWLNAADISRKTSVQSAKMVIGLSYPAPARGEAAPAAGGLSDDDVAGVKAMLSLFRAQLAGDAGLIERARRLVSSIP